jgi:hypothetical protein
MWLTLSSPNIIGAHTARVVYAYISDERSEKTERMSRTELNPWQGNTVPGRTLVVPVPLPTEMAFSPLRGMSVPTGMTNADLSMFQIGMDCVDGWHLAG